MSKQIVEYPYGEEITVKRFPLPDHEVSCKCSECGNEINKNLAEMNYISYPCVGVSEAIWWYCDECDNEWEQGEMRLSVNLEVEV